MTAVIAICRAQARSVAPRSGPQSHMRHPKPGAAPFARSPPAPTLTVFHGQHIHEVARRVAIPLFRKRNLEIGRCAKQIEQAP